MGLFDELKELGVDVDDAMRRLNNNQALYQRLLNTFTKTIQEYQVQPDFDGSNYSEIIEKAHAIKGTSGNLSIMPIYESYTKIVDLLRKDDPESARDEIKNILPVQEKIIDCIKKYMQ